MFLLLIFSFQVFASGSFQKKISVTYNWICACNYDTVLFFLAVFNVVLLLHTVKPNQKAFLCRVYKVNVFDVQMMLNFYHFMQLALLLWSVWGMTDHTHVHTQTHTVTRPVNPGVWAFCWPPDCLAPFIPLSLSVLLDSTCSHPLISRPQPSAPRVNCATANSTCTSRAQITVITTGSTIAATRTCCRSGPWLCRHHARRTAPSMCIDTQHRLDMLSEYVRLPSVSMRPTKPIQHMACHRDLCHIWKTLTRMIFHC